MLQQPRISIIMPVYNVREYIEETIDSLLNQTIGMEHLEYIFVNDGSTDGSEKIIDEYASKYNNIKAIHLKNSSGAAGKPRNVGMEHIHGKYIMFVDPDDYVFPKHVKLCMRLLKSMKVKLLLGYFPALVSMTKIIIYLKTMILYLTNLLWTILFCCKFQII